MHKMTCCICNSIISVGVNGHVNGFNAEPLMEGRCCGDCNISKVIPERNRLAGLKEELLKDFRERTEEKNKNWKFNLFSIKCKKCGSVKTEFNSELEEHTCPYYGDMSVAGKIIVKCHACGNAFTMNWWDLEK